MDAEGGWHYGDAVAGLERPVMQSEIGTVFGAHDGELKKRTDTLGGKRISDARGVNVAQTSVVGWISTNMGVRSVAGAWLGRIKED